MLTNSPSFPDPVSLLNTNSVVILLGAQWRISLLSYMQACTNTVTYINTHKRANTGWESGSRKIAVHH